MMHTKPSKKKNKHKHISNKRFAEWTPCHICGQGASSTHEIFHNGNAYIRNMSMKYNAQIPVCTECHEEIHKGNGKLDRQLKKEFQTRLMEEFDWRIEDFRKIFGRNYI